MDDTKPWDDAASRVRIQPVLDAIHQEQQSVAEPCKLCGQLSLRLDAHGLCRKISEGHHNYRLGRRVPEPVQNSRGDEG